MADGLVLTRRVSERGVHDWAQRAGGASCAGAVREYVGYEEWAPGGFVRREVARSEVALILGLGDVMDITRRLRRPRRGRPRGQVCTRPQPGGRCTLRT